MCWTLSRCCDLLSRLLFVAACGQIFYLSFRKWDAVEAFCWHPPLMSVAVLLLYQEGVRTILRPNYRAHFLKLGREWSQYLQVPLSARDTSRRRRKYAAFVCAALVTLCAGFGCAAWSKHAVGLSAVWPLTTHSIFGAAAIVLLAVHGLSVCASLPPRKKVVAGGTPSNNSRRWAAHSEEKDHDDAKTGLQRHKSNCKHFVGATACLLLILAMTLGVSEVHSSGTSGWSRGEVDCLAGLIATAIFLEFVVWVWRPALQAEQREIAKSDFPVFSKIRTTETEAW